LWFLAGFLIVFGVTLVVVNQHYMDPSGDAVVRAPLWQYYLVEIPRMFRPRLIGPASVSPSATLTTLLQHVALSAVGGFVAMAVGWSFHRVSSRKA
jgi:hypothetical protein